MVKPIPPDDRDSRQDSYGGARDELFSEDAELSGSLPDGEPQPRAYVRIRRQDQARWLKAALLRRSTVAVADVTYHLLAERSS